MPDEKQKFNLEPYKNPKAVEMLIDSMQEKRGTKFPEEERKLLSTNPALAERVFNGGLKDAIIKDKVSITELSKLSSDAVVTLTYGLTQGALNDGAIKASQVGALDKGKLEELDGLIARGNFTKTEAGDKNFNRVSEILGLDKDQSAALRKSFDNTEQKWKEDRKLSVPDVSLPNIPNLGAASQIIR